MKKIIAVILSFVAILLMFLVLSFNDNKSYLNKSVDKNVELEIIYISNQSVKNTGFLSSHTQGDIIQVDTTIDHKFSNDNLDLNIVFSVDGVEYNVIASGDLDEYKSKGNESLFMGELSGQMFYSDMEIDLRIDYRSFREHEVIFINFIDGQVFFSLNKAAMEKYIEDIDFSDYSK